MSQVPHRPLILLLDDRDESRESMRELFATIECSVIPVHTHESALDEISSRTDIDFVVTDLNLKPDIADKSGIIFAKLVKQFREDIPLAAYSANTRNLNLSANDYHVFDVFLDKKSDDPNQAMRFVTECKTLAIAHKKMANKFLDKLGSPKGRASVQFKAFETKIADLERKLSTFEQTYFKVPDIAPYANAIYVILAVLGAIASIWALYLVLR